MKKKFLLFLSLITMTYLSVSAADYFVFNKCGYVKVSRSGKTIDVTNKFILHDNDILYIGQNSSITLTNPSKRIVAIIKKKYQGKVKDAVDRKGGWAEIMRPLKSFFTYVAGLCSSDFVNEQNEFIYGDTERGNDINKLDNQKNIETVLEIINNSKVNP